MNWTGQDWAFALGGVAVFLTSVGGFVTAMVTLYRVGQVSQKVDGMLVQRDASNVAAGQIIGRQAGDDASAQRAEGRREQREIQSVRDSSAAALNVHPGGSPLPVADDRTAVAAEKGAAATERIADAAEAETSGLSKKT